MLRKVLDAAAASSAPATTSPHHDGTAEQHAPQHQTAIPTERDALLPQQQEDRNRERHYDPMMRERRRRDEPSNSGPLYPQPNDHGTLHHSLSSSPKDNDGMRVVLEEEDDDEDDYSMASDEEDDDLSSISGRRRDEPPTSVWQKTWTTLKAVFVWIVDVDNVWDDASMIEDEEAMSRRVALGLGSANDNINNRTRNKKHVVLFWFFLLAASYATERSTFKLLVDRVGPFRLVAVEMMTLVHAIMVGCGILLKAIWKRDLSTLTSSPLGIPIVDIGLMALLDTVHLLLVFLTGLHVAPTLIVILVQFTLPLTNMITQFVHPDGAAKRFYHATCGGNDEDREPSPAANRSHHSSGNSYSSRTTNENPPMAPSMSLEEHGYYSLPGWGGLSTEHVLGSTIIMLAVCLALCPAIYSIWDPSFFIYADTIPIQTACNTLLFVSSCIPAAASQLYKEHVFLQHKQPVQQDHLNLILSIFQLIFTSIMAPLVYTLLGLAASSDWPSLYPSSGYSKNFYEGIQCFLGQLDEDKALNSYADEGECDFSLALVCLHCFSIISVGVAVDKIVNAGATKVMFRGVSAGIIVAVISLYVYDRHIPDFSYGPAIDSLNLICVMLLVVGAEVYHRVSLPDATFETIFPETEDFYDVE